MNSAHSLFPSEQLPMPPLGMAPVTWIEGDVSKSLTRALEAYSVREQMRASYESSIAASASDCYIRLIRSMVEELLTGRGEISLQDVLREIWNQHSIRHIPAEIRLGRFDISREDFLPILVKGLKDSHEVSAIRTVKNEMNKFLDMRDSLLSDPKYPGTFVAILNGVLVDHDDDKVALAKRVYEKHGYVPLYIGKVEKEKKIFKIRSPRVRRK